MFAAFMFYAIEHLNELDFEEERLFGLVIHTAEVETACRL